MPKIAWSRVRVEVEYIRSTYGVHNEIEDFKVQGNVYRVPLNNVIFFFPLTLVLHRENLQKRPYHRPMRDLGNENALGVD